MFQTIIDFFKWFINGCQNFFYRNSQLLTAAKEGDAQKIDDLVKAGAFVNAKGILSGDSALIIAIKENKKEAIAKLLELKADPNLKDAKGKTPLEHAVRTLNSDAIKALFDNGADVNQVSKSGENLFSVAFSLLKKQSEDYQDDSDDQTVADDNRSVNTVIKTLFSNEKLDFTKFGKENPLLKAYKSDIDLAKNILEDSVINQITKDKLISSAIKIVQETKDDALLEDFVQFIRKSTQDPFVSTTSAPLYSALTLGGNEAVKKLLKLAASKAEVDKIVSDAFVQAAREGDSDTTEKLLAELQRRVIIDDELDFSGKFTQAYYEAWSKGHTDVAKIISGKVSIDLTQEITLGGEEKVAANIALPNVSFVRNTLASKSGDRIYVVKDDYTQEELKVMKHNIPSYLDFDPKDLDASGLGSILGAPTFTGVNIDEHFG
ncbi:MAG: ankyrin repeat domain-containing protein [Rickettsiaceae bacterium]|nr:ankyrin repeat domain-containing protein [Rickettsiaceae bacterium]